MPASPVSSHTDVAERAGVSLATASRVLNPSGHPVAEATHQRVERAARGLDFVPNRVASSLAGGRTGTIGVVVHDVTDEYCATVLRGIEDVARDRGVAVLVCNSERDPDREVGCVRTLRSMRTDAVVFAGSGIADQDHQIELERELTGLRATGGVVVRLAPHPQHASDVRSNTTGFRLVVDHLVERGHRDLAFVAGPPALAASRERLAAFRRALRRHDLTPAGIYPGDFTREGGLAAGARFVADGVPASAVVCANDQLAIGVLRALRDADLAVPDGVAVIGFDDIPACSYVAPGLATVHVPLEEMGRIGAALAFERLQGADGGTRTVEVGLVVRESTGVDVASDETGGS